MARVAEIGPTTMREAGPVLDGKRLVAFALPPAFFLRWLRAGGELECVVVPEDAKLLAILQNRAPYPEKLLLLVESAEYEPVKWPNVPVVPLVLALEGADFPAMKDGQPS